MTDQSMIERVARAIADATPGLTDEGSETPIRFTDGQWRPRWVLFTDQARAAIQAMRDYSESMSQAGGAVTLFKISGRLVGQSAAERAYLAMIDTALSE